MEQYIKVSENEIGVVETKPVEVLPQKTYDYGFLKKQLVAIQEQKDRDNALRDAEILEVQTLINEANKLGIVEKVVEEPLLEKITK